MNDLVDYANRINLEHQLGMDCAESAVAHAVRCGELLIETKAELEHGDFALSTASRYIKAAHQKSTGVDISSLSQIYQPIEDSRKERQSALTASEKSPHDLEPPSTNDVSEQPSQTKKTRAYTHTAEWEKNRLQTHQQEFCRTVWISWLQGMFRDTNGITPERYLEFVADDQQSVDALKEVLPAAIEYLQEIERGLQ